ncbi:hypothetical protein C8J57DRAFT_1642692 [Mycena rebaudengoi]|nr:hypothetical protein C8J57DRAFT_1642692 [Mycena rebaudengoi]
MQLTLIFATLITGAVCAAAPSIQQRLGCGSDATITGRSSFIGADGHELLITTASCANRRGSTSHSELSKRATCVPDPSQCHVASCLGFKEPPSFAADCKQLITSVAAFAPNFTVLESQVIFITFNTCMLDFAVGPQTLRFKASSAETLPIPVGRARQTRTSGTSGSFCRKKLRLATILNAFGGPKLV